VLSVSSLELKRHNCLLPFQKGKFHIQGGSGRLRPLARRQADVA
jgi:hypothetical protein